MFNFSKEKIVFRNSIPGVEKIMPIIPAKEYKHAWHQKALDDFANIRKNPNYGMERMLHTVRCPGIFGLQRHGWISRTWQDIVIETNGDTGSFFWHSAINQKELNGTDCVGHHPKEQFTDYMSNWKSDTLKTVIKIHTGWTCIVPKGYYLLEMPVAYLDENRFTTLPGFFDRDQGPAQMNVQLLWHVMDGKTLIKAGTPIAQYILVPKKQMEMEVKSIGKEANTQDIFDLINHNRFVKNYNEVKKFFRNLKS
jgi:dUTPase